MRGPEVLSPCLPKGGGRRRGGGGGKGSFLLHCSSMSPVRPAPHCLRAALFLPSALKKKGNEALKKGAPNITCEGRRGRPRSGQGFGRRCQGSGQDGGGTGDLGSSGVGSSHWPEMSQGRGWRKWEERAGWH